MPSLVIGLLKGDRWIHLFTYINKLASPMTDNSNKILLKELHKLYGEPQTQLTYKTDFELLVAVVLSAQCTDKKVNETTPILFKEFPNFKSLAKAKLSSVQKIIRPINYFKTKSKHLIELSKMVEERFHGKIPMDHALLIELPGVGRKTANVVLGELGAAHTLPVDTHVFRVAHRLGLSSSKTRDGVEEDICRTFPSTTWRRLHHSLILHGRQVCGARNPKCAECSLLNICPEGKLRTSGKSHG